MFGGKSEIEVDARGFTTAFLDCLVRSELVLPDGRNVSELCFCGTTEPRSVSL